ncbi:hypothetical protein HYG86_15710 [Alkalicella caledoniensis]|uniref:Type IV pilus assembly protein PilO n=1 Tax=Alkalicella caledoniensis TaxID=2731377 RepID=A0A7G9WBP8_ALKCA|nr:type 4a pilus biogenesis protein PilO [Alkalicella caledoniensis]QNO16110.1 hypothetical protein HYG86_15710 [Alkalicella caledoniensis]
MLEMFKKLSSRERNMLIILCSLIFLYVIYITLFETSMTTLKDANKQLESLQSREDELNLQLATYNGLKNRYGSYDINELQKILPAEGKVPEIILWIESLFADTGLSRPNISLNLVESQEKHMQLTLTFSGPYNSIYSLINNIENNTRLTKIERVNLNGNQGSLNANLVVNVYGQSFHEVPDGQFNFSNEALFRGQ